MKSTDTGGEGGLGCGTYRRPGPLTRELIYSFPVSGRATFFSLFHKKRRPRQLREAKQLPRVTQGVKVTKAPLLVAASEGTPASTETIAKEAPGRLSGAVLQLWGGQGPTPTRSRVVQGVMGRQGTLRLACPPALSPQLFLEPSFQADSPAPSGSLSEIAGTKVPPIPKVVFSKNASRQTHKKVVKTRPSPD